MVRVQKGKDWKNEWGEGGGWLRGDQFSALKATATFVVFQDERGSRERASVLTE